MTQYIPAGQTVGRDSRNPTKQKEILQGKKQKVLKPYLKRTGTVNAHGHAFTHSYGRVTLKLERLPLFMHSAKGLIAQEERLTASPNR